MDRPSAPPPMPGNDQVYRWLYYLWEYVGTLAGGGSSSGDPYQNTYAPTSNVTIASGKETIFSQDFTINTTDLTITGRFTII